MKKIVTLFWVAIFMVISFAACSGKDSAQNAKAAGKSMDQDKISVVTTIFPEYDWVKNIVLDSENVQIEMLLDNGVDLHSFQPTMEDMLKIQNCDLFIYVGGESDEWIEDLLAKAEYKNVKAINLLEALGDDVKAEEIVEGMEHEHEHEHEHGDGDEHDHEDGDHHDGEEEHDHEAGDHHDGEEEHDHEDGDHHDGEEEHDHEEEEWDEHVWLSLKNASKLCKVIADGLCEVDAEHKETYLKNLESYQAKLAKLDKEYNEVVGNAKHKTVLFGDRFPFRYLVDDYGLDYYAAFVGCSAETEASFETVLFLANKVDELGLPAIMTIEGKDHGIAESIRSATKAKDQEILTLDSMQGTTMKDVEAGASYEKIMTENLETLKKAIQ